MGIPLQVIEAEPILGGSKPERLLAYWEEKRGRREMPARGDLDPADIADILPYIYLIDISYDPNVFRFRLAGTEVVRMFGEEISGKATDQLASTALRAHLRERYEDTLKARTPTHDAATGRAKATMHTRLLLPLSTDGRRVDMLMGCVA